VVNPQVFMARLFLLYPSFSGAAAGGNFSMDGVRAASFQAITIRHVQLEVSAIFDWKVPTR
jgi:hypothetical protein